MNKIMQGNLKNSADQTNEDNPLKEIQTEDILCEDFENQCPEDYFKVFLKENDVSEQDFTYLAHTQKFIKF